MKLWIRVDASAPRDPAITRIADELGIRVAEALGLCASVWCAMSEHAVRGDIGDVPDRTLESWAQWEGRRGRFAPVFRAAFAPAGVVHGWSDRQGALLTRMERDRLRHRRDSTEPPRKVAADSAEVPRSLRGKSTSTVRNGTEVQEQKPKDGTRATRSAPWMGKIREIHRARYESEPPVELVRALRPLVTEHGPEEVAARYERYCVHTAGDYYNPWKLKTTWSDWAENAPSRGPPNGKPAAGDQSIRNTELALGVKLR